MYGAVFGTELDAVISGVFAFELLLLVSTILLGWPVNFFRLRQFDAHEYLFIACLFVSSLLFASSLYWGWPVHVFPPNDLQPGADFSGQGWQFQDWYSISSNSSQSWRLSYEGYFDQTGCPRAVSEFGLADLPFFHSNIIFTSGDYSNPAKARFAYHDASYGRDPTLARGRAIQAFISEPGLNGSYYNIHAIPGNAVVLQVLNSLKPFDLVRIRGREVYHVTNPATGQYAGDQGCNTLVIYGITVLLRNATPGTC